MDYKKGGGLILSSERAQLVDGLWTIQKYGDFAPGDKRLARVFVTGRVEMRQLGGLFKLSFDGLALSPWARHVDIYGPLDCASRCVHMSHSGPHSGLT